MFHPNCRCVLLLSPDPPKLSAEMIEAGRKFDAAVILSDTRQRIIVPPKGEWIGLNLLERDDGLPSKESK